MNIYTNNEHIIIESDGNRIYYSRNDGCFSSPDESSNLNAISADPVPCGIVELFIGVLRIEDVDYLFFVTESSTVAHYRGVDGSTSHDIKRIERVVAISSKDGPVNIRDILQTDAKSLKQNTGKFLKYLSEKISKVPKPALLEDCLRLFNDSKDFYFCRQRNVTISAQKFFTKKSNNSEDSFFWNKSMLEPVEKGVNGNISQWTCPIMQGFVASVQLSLEDQKNVTLFITIISRRSIHRAGARYLRRGIDEKSNVANFVETELILNIFHHELSFVQIRGSIPLFWSQRGYKYRPPLVINRSFDESHQYFAEHIKRIRSHYDDPIVAVSLIDQRGREFQLAQKLLEHTIKLNDEKLTFVSFDLHNHCRGLNFRKVQDLIKSLEEKIKQIGFCWIDKTGEVVQRQTGVIRTNCIDCLDRTNLVQGQISLHVVLQQAQRLGIFGPLCETPENLVTTLQSLWADNGDAISTQYAGTAALKGDVTRCGERRLVGIMKDGYNSASRYYLTHTRDAARQKAINLVTNQLDFSDVEPAGEESEKEEEENITRLVAETVQFLVPPEETVIAGWGLINACSINDEIDTIVILTRRRLYIASYEIDGEKMNDVSILALEDITSIETGIAVSRQCVRIQTHEEYFIWKSSQMRLFNNVAIRLKTIDEANEYISSIAEQINVAKNMETGSNSIVRTGVKISIAQLSMHKSLAAVGSLLTKFKNVNNKKTNQQNMARSSSAAPIVSVDGCQSADKQNDIMSKFIKNAFKREEELHEPFQSYLENIKESNTDIRLL